MSPPRLLKVEAIEDRVVPAAISVSYLGSTWLVRSMETNFGDFRRAQSPTITRADLFRVTNDDGSSQYMVRVPSWNGGWNSFLSPSLSQSARVSSSSQSPTTSSNDSVPYSPTFIASRGAGANKADSTNSGASRDSEPSVQRISVPASLGSGSSETGGNSGTTGTNETQAQSQPVQQRVAVESGSSSAPRFFPLIGSMNEIVMPADGGVPSADVPPANPNLQSQSAEPPTVLESELPAIAAHVIQHVPLAGLIPFNVRELENGVRNVLDRVATLDESWVEDASGMEDYLWIAAGALVAGGVMQTAWSRRSQFTDRRVLGMDSVLARWGSQHDGGLRG